MRIPTRALLALLAVCATARAEDLVFFKASTAGQDVWSWAGARAKMQGGELRLIESNPAGDYGDAFVADRLPYLDGGVILLDVSAVDSGTYTLQLLGFKGATHASTAEPVKDVAQPGRHEIRLPAPGLAADTDTVMLKLWVGGAEGAVTRVRELTYRAPVNTERALVDDRFADLGAWTVEQDRLALARGPSGAVLQLQGSHTFAPASRRGTLPREQDAIVLVHVVSTPGTATLQLDTFDAGGAFVGAVDLIKDAGAGWHAAPLSRAAWPGGAASYALKLWVGGNPGSATVIDRIVVAPR